jgi:glycosyltransferase involved in cell wall biosynthesis
MSGRICLVRQTYFPAEAHLRKNVNALADAGFRVDVVCLREPGSPSREVYRGGTVYRLPLTHKREGMLRYLFEYGGFFLLALLQLAWLSLIHPYETVEVYNLPDFLVLSALPARLRGSRVVLYLFEMMPEQVGHQYGLGRRHPVSRALRWLEGVCVRFADRVIAVSPHQRATIMRRSRPRLEPIVVANAPDMAVFAPGPSPEANHEPFRLMTHGSLLRRYSIDTLIRAVPHLQPQIPELEVLIVGRGEERQRLERLARRLGVQNAVRFEEWVEISRMPEYIAQADIGVVSASADWLLPNKLLEYVSMSKPVVAARSDAISYVFGGESLAYFRASDEQELARRVIELYRDPKRRRRLAENASHDLAPYRWELARESYIGLHRALINSRNGNRAHAN